MRIAIATLIGGLALFLWGAFAHMVLPLGEMSMRAPLAEDPVIAALKQGLPAEQGIYVLPHFDPSMHADKEALATFSAKTRSNPYAFIVYAPEGRDPMAMGPQLAGQWLSDTLGVLIFTLVLFRYGASVPRGVTLGLAIGVIAWLSLSVPFWNWYRFPAAFTFGYLIEQAFGWAFAGAVSGWWLSRKKKT
ncbi:MAG: hypothetical protein GAK28_04848 [Luteibacter sp.]|uniref:hypothetical protein n=1 Tax=Luteibacter sp. TaxID=1886636 RepID=UPI00137EB37C|nr:hypothetical protein [Luteibacter sp.]KAF1003241.1 MAG: hypothetical protein GAK28_04848 [Luteibacter sp.]